MKITMEHENRTTTVEATDGRVTITGALDLFEAVLAAQGFSFDRGTLGLDVTLASGEKKTHLSEEFYYD